MTLRESIARALDLLAEDLQPVLQQALKDHYGERWLEAARQSFRTDRNIPPDGQALRWDAHAVLTVLWDQWPHLYRDRWGPFERSLVSELREFRNRWAHQHEFDFDDAYRCLDTAHRLLRMFDTPHADELAGLKKAVLGCECDRLAEAASARDQRRGRRLVAAVYAACCLAIVAQGWLLWGSKAWFFAVFVILTFAFLTWQHLRRPTFVGGPRECARCGRIIYSHACPYCSAATANHTGSAHSADRRGDA